MLCGRKIPHWLVECVLQTFLMSCPVRSVCCVLKDADVTFLWLYCSLSLHCTRTHTHTCTSRIPRNTRSYLARRLEVGKDQWLPHSLCLMKVLPLREARMHRISKELLEMKGKNRWSKTCSEFFAVHVVLRSGLMAPLVEEHTKKCS